MSNRKQRREIDKAIQHLMQFQVEQEPWSQLMEDFLTQMFAPLANRNDLSVEDAENWIMASDYSDMAYGYLVDEFATTSWDGASENMIDEYLQQRGWREGAHGRRYLRALGSSELELWEVVAVKPDISVDIRRHGLESKPIRVKEQSASGSLQIWDCIAARVLRVDGRPMFAGGMLSFTPPEARVIERTLVQAGKDLSELLSDAQNSGELKSAPEEMETWIEAEMRNQFADVAFTVWTQGIIEAENRPAPQLFNMDNEPIELTRLRYPLIGERELVAAALNNSPVLTESAENSWSWYPQPFDDISDDETRVPILGHISLEDAALELEVNSAPRAERGREFIHTLVGEHLGEPLTVHENLEMAMEEGVNEPDINLNDAPEIQAALDAHLTAHYRQTLDEPIPMLNDKSPRDCAADPVARHEVIEWLKYLENTNQRSPQSHYDFTWMWQELGLEREK
jgi:hypothetical protein